MRELRAQAVTEFAREVSRASRLFCADLRVNGCVRASWEVLVPHPLILLISHHRLEEIKRPGFQNHEICAFLRFRCRFLTFCVFQLGPLQGRLHRCRYSALDAKTLRKLAMASNGLWRGLYFWWNKSSKDARSAGNFCKIRHVLNVFQ